MSKVEHINQKDNRFAEMKQQLCDSKEVPLTSIRPTKLPKLFADSPEEDLKTSANEVHPGLKYFENGIIKDLQSGCLNFILDTYSLKKTYSTENNNKLFINTNVIIEFVHKSNESYIPYFIRAANEGRQMIINDIRYSVYDITLMVAMKLNKHSEYYVMIPMYEIKFIPELYPSLRANCIYGCNLANGINYQVIDSDFGGDGSLRIPACKITKKCREECLAFKAIIPPDQALSILSYTLRIYNNRNSLRRKNSKFKDEYFNNPVSYVCQNFNEIIVPIYDTKIDSEDVVIRSGSTHSKHASPREHFRQSYWRCSKNGKLTRVKSTIVNKGHGKILYEVKN